MIKIIVARGSQPTGETLKELLREREIELTERSAEAQAIVSYGVTIHSPSVPTLNAKAGAADKFVELELLRDAGVSVPAFWWLDDTDCDAIIDRQMRLVARKRHHQQARDVRIVTTPLGLRIRRQQGWDYATQFLNSETEYRVWIYRRRHLRTYEKVRTRRVKLHRLKKFVRNHRAGFGFQLVPSDAVPREAVAQSVAAIEALKLDFGAVDVLQHSNGRFYVLEVNTAPGVEGPRESLVALVDKIARWVERGYPVNRRDRGESA